MKKYDARDVVLQRGVEWVPADVAQSLYFELDRAAGIMEIMIAKGHTGYTWNLQEMRKALSKADEE